MRKGWIETTLKEIAIARGLQTGPFGSQLKASEYVVDASGVPIIMPQDVYSGKIHIDNIARTSKEKAETLKRHFIKKGDVIFPRRGDLTRIAVASPEQNGWLCGTGCLRARIKDTVNPDFLGYFLEQKEIHQWLMDNAVGQTMLNISTEIIGKLPIALPPLAEQKKIATILRTWDEGIEKVERIHEQKMVLWKAQRAQLLKELGKKFGFSDIEKMTSEIVGGGTPSRGKPSYWNGNIPWVSVKDLIAPVLSGTQEHISEKALEESASNLIPAFMPIVATRMAVGRAAYFTVDVAINQDLKALIPTKECEARYLFHCLRALEGRLATQGTGSTVNGITLDILKEQVIPKADKKAQRIFINLADAKENELNFLHDKILHLKSQKRGLMQKLLTGEWLVRMDKEAA